MRKLGLVGLALVAACSADPSAAGPRGTRAPAAGTPGVSAAQLQDFATLEAETKLPWTWLQHETLKTPMHLSAPRAGRPLLAKGVTAEQATLAFVGQHAALFKMRDAARELSVARTETDALSMTHVRFQQVHEGVPVQGAELAAHYDAVGHLTSIDANYVSGIDLDVHPVLTVEAARAIVKAELVARTPSLDTSALAMDDGHLVIHVGDRGPALAYRIVTPAVFGPEPAIWITTVDARTGEVLERHNNLQTVQGTGVGVLGDTKKLEVTLAGGTYKMTDTSRGVAISTYNAGRQEIGPSQGAASVTSSSLTSWDTGTGAGAAVDAHFYAGAVFDYYKKVHGRNAIDGAGGAMLSTAHFGVAYDNAFWDGTGMSYGDGGQMFRPLSAGLDVCAHEFTHGVTEKTSNLAYSAQSGALNESVSDIFGVFIEHSVYPDDTKNWTMGENIAKSSGALRDFKNPANGQQPAAMSQYVNTQQDEGGVHTNSGIPNNAAYLMTMGGTNPASKTVVAFGLGWEKSEQLWYRANTKYFLSTTNFAQAAQATMSAAQDLGLTDNEQNIVDCAWKATGVVQGSCETLTDPSIVTPPVVEAGPDAEADAGDDGAEEEEVVDAAPKKKKLRVIQSSGCQAAPGSTDLAPLGGVLAAMLMAARARRRRR
ncbi:MAG: Zinc metalloproteinase precursor [Labilithrix sp.]|nr:Zinc metalloproteinase precursor [Labilithrix sp.]